MKFSANPMDTDFTERQRDVLDAALALMVEEGDGLTMNGVAARAHCSKETLYKWFGDRDGLLAATVQFQASKVYVAVPADGIVDEKALRTVLEQFALNWLLVLTSDLSAALNGMAVSHARGAKSDLGRVVLHNGPFEVARRIEPVFEMGRAAGFLVYEDFDVTFRTFFGLVVRDVQIRVLLGDDRSSIASDLAGDAGRAVEQFLTLFARCK